jgi:hypothetical protein
LGSGRNPLFIIPDSRCGSFDDAPGGWYLRR